MSIKCLRFLRAWVRYVNDGYVSDGFRSDGYVSAAVGSGALEASFRAKPVANRRADAQPRLNPYMWSTLAMETFEHSNEAKVKVKNKA